MPDKEEAIQELELVYEYIRKEVHDIASRKCRILDKVRDALALLKEQHSCENCAIAIEDRQLIIRCKECKHHYNVIRCRCGGFTPDDWFCAGGKRRTDDD